MDYNFYKKQSNNILIEIHLKKEFLDAKKDSFISDIRKLYMDNLSNIGNIYLHIHFTGGHNAYIIYSNGFFDIVFYDEKSTIVCNSIYNLVNCILEIEFNLKKKKTLKSIIALYNFLPRI